MVVVVAEKKIIRVYTYNNELYLEGYTLQSIGASSRVKGDPAQLYRVTEKDLDDIIRKSESRGSVIYDKQYEPVSRDYLNKKAYLEKSNKFSDSIGTEQKSSNQQQPKTSGKKDAYHYIGKTPTNDSYSVFLDPTSMEYDIVNHYMSNRRYHVEESGSVYDLELMQDVCQLYPDEIKRFWDNAMKAGAYGKCWLFQERNKRSL